jgi:NADH-quinone oxidoreductase subunit N
MTRFDFLFLTPLIILAAAPIVIMIAVTVARNLRLVYLFSLFALFAAFLSLFLIPSDPDHSISQLLRIDTYSIVFLGILYFAAMLITILSYDYLEKLGGEREEYFIILFVAMLGASVLVMAEHFVTFFIGLETLSISLYILIAYLKFRDQSIEAGVKFLVIASVTTAFLLLGMGLIYAETGKMNFREILPPNSNLKEISPLFLIGFGLMMGGIGFKLALVPFHMWTPDIYHGAPVPVTTFIATISKGAVMALALRLFNGIRGFDNTTLVIVVSSVSILSMFAGNLLALRQNNTKRLLAYSSIAHLGYLLIPLLTGTRNGLEAAVFYIAAYTVTSLGAFGVISVLSVSERDSDSIKDLNGLFWSNPFLAIVFTLSLLSLAGLPLTAGFMSKFFIVLSGVSSGLWILAFSLVVNSVISLYYYLRLVKAMFTPSEIRQTVRVSYKAGFVLLVASLAIIVIGILPSLLTRIIAGVYLR